MQFAGISPREDQSIAGSIMWVPGSIIYLVPGVILAVRLVGPAGSLERLRTSTHNLNRQRRAEQPRKLFDLLRLPLLGSFVHWKHSRRIAQSVMLILAIAIASDGLFGDQ